MENASSSSDEKGTVLPDSLDPLSCFLESLEEKKKVKHSSSKKVVTVLCTPHELYSTEAYVQGNDADLPDESQILALGFTNLSNRSWESPNRSLGSPDSWKETLDGLDLPSPPKSLDQLPESPIVGSPKIDSSSLSLTPLRFDPIRTDSPSDPLLKEFSEMMHASSPCM